VSFDITALDEAGNTVTKTLVLLIAPPVASLAIAFASTPLVFVEKSGSLPVDPLATFAWVGAVDVIDVYLVGAAGDLFGAQERVTATAPTGATVSASTVDATTGARKISIACAAVGSGCMAPAAVQAALQSLAYANSFVDPVVGGRRVEVRIYHADGYMVSPPASS
jgi:hypothetical protein